MDGDLWVVGAGLDADVAPRAAGLELVTPERGQLLERGGPAVGQPEPCVEQRGPEPNRQGQRRRRQAERLTGVLRHAVGSATGDATRGSLGTGGHPLGCPGPRPEQVDELSPVRGDDVEGDEVQSVLSGSGDPRLMRPGEGHRSLGGNERALAIRAG